MNLIEYPDREMMMMDIAQTIAGELETCLFNHEHASLAVPGGTTPGPIFDSLSAAKLDWSRVHVLLTDERWVPETSERSNTRLLRERLFTGPAAEAVMVPLYRDGATPEDALPGLSEGLAPELPISILVLGMGADMHTASLFPDAPELSAALAGRDGPLAVVRPEGQPEARITLTGPVLRSAMTTHVVITGAEKRAALERARHLGAEEAPISIVLRDAAIHWAE